MMLAELPDPNSFSSIGWVVVILAAIAYGLNQGWELINRFRGDSPHPPNSQLESDHRALKSRVKSLEEWKDGLIKKLEEDKQEILDAGQKRETNLRGEIQIVATGLSDLQKMVATIPAEFFAMLANAKNLLGGNHD
jgi:hypothetical protein